MWKEYSSSSPCCPRQCSSLSTSNLHNYRISATLVQIIRRTEWTSLQSKTTNAEAEISYTVMAVLRKDYRLLVYKN